MIYKGYSAFSLYILVDQFANLWYNRYMMKKRKTRKDRNHIGYMITNIVTGERYIGITVINGTANKSLKVRWQKHVRRALTEGRVWAFCKSIRKHGADNFVQEQIFKIRGRLEAHAMERQYIADFKPELNQY